MFTSIHTILLPVDFSEQAQYAFQLGCALARDFNARIVLLHVAEVPAVVHGEGVPPPEPRAILDEYRELLHQVPVPDDVPVDYRLVEGDPAGCILHAALQVGADMIVMGTHGRRGLSRLLMGSVAEEVVRNASCPVVTTRVPVPALAAAAPEGGVAASSGRGWPA